MTNRRKAPRRPFQLLAAAGMVCVMLAVVADGFAARPAADERRRVAERRDDEDVRRGLLERGPGGESARNAQRIRELMDESKRRLESADPGEETQQVQEQIVRRLDELIEQMRTERERREQQEKRHATRCGGRGGRPDDGTVGGGGGGGTADAGETGDAGEKPGRGDGAEQAASSDGEMAQTIEGWAQVHPKLRGPVIEGATEQVSDKYAPLVADYYRCVAERATK